MHGYEPFNMQDGLLEASFVQSTHLKPRCGACPSLLARSTGVPAHLLTINVSFSIGTNLQLQIPGEGLRGRP